MKLIRLLHIVVILITSVGFISLSCADVNDPPVQQQIQLGSWTHSAICYKRLCIGGLEFVSVVGDGVAIIQVIDANGKPKTCSK